MKLALALSLLVACAGPKPKPESPIVNEGSDAPETCCCKSTPVASEEGKPLYQMVKRMECSAVQGACVDDVQCQKTSDKTGDKPE